MGRIAFQGEPGANSDEACRTHFPDHEPLPCATFDEAFEAVKSGAAELGMIPVENSIAGRVADVRPYLWGAALAVAPLRVARGIQNKVLEALACGVPVVATSAALTHFTFLNHHGAVAASDPSRAVMFFTAMDAPGLKLFSRNSYERQARAAGTPWDYPLSSRFDENDAVTDQLSGLGPRSGEAAGDQGSVEAAAGHAPPRSLRRDWRAARARSPDSIRSARGAFWAEARSARTASMAPSPVAGTSGTDGPVVKGGWASRAASA